MKARVPDQFFLYALNFTLESMIQSVIYWSFDVYNNPESDSNGLFGERSIIINNHKVIVPIVQTWLLDLIYDLIIHNRYGVKIITNKECLYLIGLHNDYLNYKSRSNRKNKKDVLFEIVGFGGEQNRFQANYYLEEYSRETYILEDISKRINYSKTQFDFEKEFNDEMNLSSLEFSRILFSLFAFYNKNVTKLNIDSNSWFSKLHINPKDIHKVITRYSIDIKDIRKDENNRQIFYLKPFIHLGNAYYPTNPFILEELFANSKYWVIRDRYFRMKSSFFVNTFGKMFECYVEEILQNCLSACEYEKIQEVNNAKRADWKLTLGKYTMLIEQKSSHPVLRIKQNETDTEAIKNYMKKCWGEAVDQLVATEQAFNLNHAIKVVLIYDTYFRSEAFDLLFTLRTDVVNDGYYWLIDISECETLMYVYKTDKKLFNTIIDEKINSVSKLLKSGQNFKFIYSKHNISSGTYLKSFGIMKKANDALNIV